MIWAWIIAAVIISWLFCKKGIGWYHFIWILLPIEMYGVTVAGATIKPYMLFGCLIILGDLLKHRTLRIHATLIAVAFALIISDYFTGFVMASVMQHIMFALVLLIGYCYQDYQTEGIEFEEIGHAVLATTIGYGLVFTAAWLTHSFGYSIDGVYASERLDAGIVLKLASFGGTVSLRLRGFCIDPNSVIATLIPGAAYAMANITFKKQDLVKSVLGIVLYFAVVFYSGSRMALLCSFAMLVVFFVFGYRRSENKRRMAVIGIVSVIVVIIIALLRFNTIILEMVKICADLFGERASIGSEYGRLTIWKMNLSYLIDTNKIWFGVGQNQIYLLTQKGLACHNTWLEWICGTGIVIGLLIDFWFIFAPVCFRKRLIGKNNMQKVITLVLSYITVVVCISTVDNITNSVLIFLMLILRYGTIKDDSLTERVV